jgi:hypothetical protein
VTYPCSKEGDIATLKANAEWQNKKLEKIERNTEVLVTRMGSNDIKWARLGMLVLIGSGAASVLFQVMLTFAK